MPSLSRLTLLSLVLLVLGLAGCDSDDSSSSNDTDPNAQQTDPNDQQTDPNDQQPEDTSDNGGSGSVTPSEADLPDGKTLVFYSQDSTAQYSYNTDTDAAHDLNSDSTSNFYARDKEMGRLFHWPDEYEPGQVDEKVILFKADYTYSSDDPVDHEDFLYLGHFHGDELAAHSADEFDPDNPSFSDGKQAALERLNEYLAHRKELETELTTALQEQAPNDDLCAFLVPEHGPQAHGDHGHEEDHAHDAGEHGEDGHNEDGSNGEAPNDENHTGESSVPHYVLARSGQVFVFEDHEGDLEPYQPNPVQLSGLSLCDANNRGSLTRYGAHGILVFAEQSQRLYLVDEHGLDYHEHSMWNGPEFLPGGVAMTQMIGVNNPSGEDSHDHGEDSHDHGEDSHDHGEDSHDHGEDSHDHE